MKPQVRPDQVPLELDDWHTQVVQHRDTLHALAWPQPSIGDLDSVRVQGGAGTNPADSVDSPPRRLWRNLEDITERQHWWTSGWLTHHTINALMLCGTRWQAFRNVVDHTDLATLEPELWDELHLLLVDMRTVRYGAEKLLRSGPSPAWRPGNARLPRDKSRYLMTKLHARRVRGMSEVPTEREAGLQ